MTERIKCFIAMAFDREDTDALYDRVIKPTLNDILNIKPIRVDREHFYQNIDTYMIEKIKESDFVVSDLTYARPSVYYESGYAEREIPVIYICRKDHFEPKIDDPEGNRKIHFDLNMKPIIPWTSQSHKTFQKKLLARIRQVIHPIVKDKEHRRIEADERKHFNSYSMEEQIHLLNQRAHKVVLDSKYGRKIVEKSNDALNPYIKKINHTLYVLYIVVAESFKRDSFYWVVTMIDLRNRDFVFNLGKIAGISTIQEHIFLVSLRGTRVETLKKEIPHARLGNLENEILFEKKQYLNNFTGDTRKIREFTKNLDVSWTMHLHFVSTIKSLNSLEGKLKEKIALLQ